VAVFINGESRVDRRTLSTPVPEVSEVHLKAFPGLHIRIVLTDPRDGAGSAAVQQGHFGAKLHRREDRGATRLSTDRRPVDHNGRELIRVPLSRPGA